MRPAATAAVVAVCLLCVGTAAEGRLRVGTSGDYAPFSQGAQSATGFDVELVRAYAEERGLALELVAFRWPELTGDLVAGRFDLAAGGITVRPERSLAGIFTVPVAQTGAVVLVREPARFDDLGDLDDPAVRLAVNAGGHLERVARERFPAARILALAGNAAVPEALREGAADAALSDSAEAPLWRAAQPGLGVLGPFTHDWKAWLVRRERADLAEDLDAWLLAREADGRLAALRHEHLGAGTEATALPVLALLAAIGERLDLMPLVAESKREAGVPLHDAPQEERVIASALAAAREAALRRGLPAPDAEALRSLFEALLAAGREIQAAVLARAPARGPRFDLALELRPVLLRLGERIARLTVALPASLEVEAVHALARERLRTRDLPPDSLRALAEGVVACAPRVAPDQRSLERLQERTALRTSL